MSYMTKNTAYDKPCPFNKSQKCLGHVCTSWRWKDPYYEYTKTSLKWDIYPVKKFAKAFFTFNWSLCKEMHRKEKFLQESTPLPPENDALGEWKLFDVFNGNGWDGKEGYRYATWKRAVPDSIRRGYCGIGGKINFRT